MLIFTEYDPVCLCVWPFRVDKEQLVNRKPVHSDLQVETSLFFVGSLCQTWPRYVQPLIGLGLAPCADWLGCVPCADWLGCVPRADWLNFFIAPIGFGLSNVFLSLIGWDVFRLLIGFGLIIVQPRIGGGVFLALIGWDVFRPLIGFFGLIIVQPRIG